MVTAWLHDAPQSVRRGSWYPRVTHTSLWGNWEGPKAEIRQSLEAGRRPRASGTGLWGLSFSLCYQATKPLAPRDLAQGLLSKPVKQATLALGWETLHLPFWPGEGDLRLLRAPVFAPFLLI